MRADRLVAVLLLLQSRGQVTAAEVAAELEVSERTARRDLEALAMSGVPVFSRQGRNGGWRLVGGARTDLSGLNDSEVRALFMVAGPSSAATPQVKAALRKLVRALPEPFRDRAEAAASAVVVDPSAWGRPQHEPKAPRFLDDIQRSVVDGEQINLGYVARDRSPSTRRVHPLGLVAKGSVWYLVANTDAGLRTFRVERITSVEPTGARVVRPEGFDLAAAWKLIADEFGHQVGELRARGHADPAFLPLLRMVLGTRVRIGSTGADGWVEIEIGGRDDRSLAGLLAGFGAAVVISEPPELRALLAALGAELTATYAEPAN
jgi:predicted DNA-binding transcriptional regulator YafY